MPHEDCLFCKILAGEIPCKKVYENDSVLAFDDISPQMPVHVLVIPKTHYDSLADDVPPAALGDVFSAAAHVADIKGLTKRGFRVIANTNDDAQQTVHHLHVHVLGGAPMNSGNPSREATRA